MNTTATSYEAQLAQEAHSQDPTRATDLPSGPPNPPRLLPVPRRAPRAEPPGNQVYFVQRPFCASNTRLLGKSAKRMKHELSFFFNTNPTGAILYPSHRKVSPTWTRDMCTLLWGTRLWTSILENCNKYLKAEMASFISSWSSSRLSTYLLPTFHHGIRSITYIA